MKIFKTILWTTLFWMLALGGLWIASFYEAQVSNAIITVLPEPVRMKIYNQGLAQGTQQAQHACVCPACEAQPLPTPQDQRTDNTSYLPQDSTQHPTPQTKTTEEVQILKSRVDALEYNFNQLINMLYTPQVAPQPVAEPAHSYTQPAGEPAPQAYTPNTTDSRSDMYFPIVQNTPQASTTVLQ
ncbi:MAG: hypothetical protein Q4B28_06000 [bacterium]|nr:hypothetical protein [bacterium]